MNQTNNKAISSTNRTAAPRAPRALSPSQIKVLPLLEIFNAAKAKGLKISPENKVARIYAVNKFLNNFDQFDWIEESFKELLKSPAAITVIAFEINFGGLTW